MTLISRFKPLLRHSAPEETAAPATTTGTSEKHATVADTSDAIASHPGNDDLAVEQPEKDLVPTEDAQRGVQQVEAVTLTWTKPYLIAVFIL